MNSQDKISIISSLGQIWQAEGTSHWESVYYLPLSTDRFPGYNPVEKKNKITDTQFLLGCVAVYMLLFNYIYVWTLQTCLCENVAIHPFNGIVLHVGCLKLICLASPHTTRTLSPEAMNKREHSVTYFPKFTHVSNLPDFDEIIHIIANEQDRDFRAHNPRLCISELPLHAFSPFWEMCYKLRNLLCPILPINC